MTSLFIKIFFIYLLIERAHPWDLSDIGIKSYSLLHVSVYNNRALLSIKPKSCVQYEICPTLIETSLSGKIKPKIFPSVNAFKRTCDSLLTVIGTDVDSLGRIWILDDGDMSLKCPAKIVIFNVIFNQITGQIIINKGRNERLSKLLLDKTPLAFNRVAYVGVKNFNIIYYCHLFYSKCNRIYLNGNNDDIDNGSISSEYLDMSIKENSLYLTSSSTRRLFKLNLWSIQYRTTNESVHVKYVGDKLAQSKGLLINSQYGLCYYLVRDFAIVCWNMRFPFTAEGHVVLEQSYSKLSDFVQLLNDNSANIWAAVSPKNIFLLNTNDLFTRNVITEHLNTIYEPRCIKITNNLYHLI